MTFKSKSGLINSIYNFANAKTGVYENMAITTYDVIETLLAGKIDIISLSSPRVNGAGRENIRFGDNGTTPFSGSFWSFNSGESIDMFCYLDRNYGYSGIALDILFFPSGHNATGQVTWETDIQRMSVGDQLGTGTYSYKQTNMQIGNSGLLHEGTIIFHDTEMKGWGPDEYAFIRLKRASNDGVSGLVPLWSYSARENLYSGITQ